MFDKRPRVLVEIFNKNVLKARKKCPIEGNEVEIEPRRTRNPGWYAKYNPNKSIVYRKGWWIFKRNHLKYEIQEGADEFTDKSKDPIDTPVWDRRMEKETADAYILKHAGTSMQKIQIPMWLIVIIMLNFGLSFLILLVTSGRVRFG